MATIPLNKLAEKLGATLDETARAIKIKIFDQVIMNTRVGNPDGWASPAPPGYVGGRLRGNWQTTTGTPADGELDRIDKTGTKAMNEVRGGVKGNTIDFLTNNLPYAEIWEEKDGMISRAVARIERNVKEAIK